MEVSFQFVVSVVAFAITVGTLIWRMAILHHQCNTNTESLKRAHERIDKLEDTQTVKIEKLSVQIQELCKAQIRMEEKLNFLVKLERKREGPSSEGEKK